MSRLLLFALLLAPSIAAAQVNGVKLVYKDATVLRLPSAKPGDLAVGKDSVAVLPSEVGPPGLFQFDGTRRATFTNVSGHCVLFVGDHLYLATDVFGFHVFETKGWQTVESIKDPAMSKIGRMEATPDGRTVFTLRHMWPATLTVYDRDTKTGKLTKAQIFQSDEASLAEGRRLAAANPGLKIVIDKGAVRVPNFDYATSMRMSADGQFLFVSNNKMAALAFGRGENGWKVVDTVRESVGGVEKYGLKFCESIEPVNGSVFVGGKHRLSWFTFDGKKFHFKKFLVDDGEPIGHQYETVPYLDNVLSLASSKNGKFLFVAAGDDGGFSVLKIGLDDLEFVGKVNDSPKGTRMIEVAMSRDGKHLFAKTTKSQLLIYDLDASFVK